MTQEVGTVSRELTDLVGMNLRVEQHFLTTCSQVISLSGEVIVGHDHRATISKHFQEGVFMPLNVKTGDFKLACFTL